MLSKSLGETSLRKVFELIEEKVNYLKGLMDSKASSSHTHSASEVNGLSTVATSGSYNDLSNKPTILSASNKGYNGAITAGADGVAEVGKYIDFHESSGGTEDYTTRFVCQNTSTPNSVNLPSGTGTLLIGDKSYKIVTSSSAPTTNDTNAITLVV